MARAVGGRDVEPAAGDVDPQVLPEVGELQGGADRVGAGQEVAAADAVEMEQQAADRVRRAPAVIEQQRAVGVARDRDVLDEGIEQRVRGR